MKLIYILLLIPVCISCSKTNDNIDIEKEPSAEDVNTEHLLFSINVPDNYIRKNIDKIHFVLYDDDDQVLVHRSHSSGNAEILDFYHELPLIETNKYSFARITDFQEQVFSIRLYKDLTGAEIKKGIHLQRNAVARSTNILDLPINEMEEGHFVSAQGAGYSMITSGGNLHGHFSSDYENELGTENLCLLYINDNGLSGYKYMFIPSDDLNQLNFLDPSAFIDEETRYDRISFYNPYSRTLIKIRGYEDEIRFNANLGHTIHASNTLSDFGGVSYSYPDFLHKIVSSVQLENYETEQIGPLPENLILPEDKIDYSYAPGQISFQGVPGYEVSRFLLRSSGQIHVTYVVVADGESREITIPELPDDLFPGMVGDALSISKLSFQQGAAENYQGYTDYSEYIFNTLINDQPYYLNSPRRERIFKSSVSSQMLPF